MLADTIRRRKLALDSSAHTASKRRSSSCASASSASRKRPSFFAPFRPRNSSFESAIHPSYLPRQRVFEDLDCVAKLLDRDLEAMEHGAEAGRASS
jgi:hypothetical protein